MSSVEEDHSDTLSLLFDIQNILKNHDQDIKKFKGRKSLNQIPQGI